MVADSLLGRIAGTAAMGFSYYRELAQPASIVVGTSILLRFPVAQVMRDGGGRNRYDGTY